MGSVHAAATTQDLHEGHPGGSPNFVPTKQENFNRIGKCAHAILHEKGS